MCFRKISWFPFLALFALSCLDEPDCYQLNNNMLNLSYKIMGGKADQVPFLGIQSTASDSVFNDRTIASSAILPLNPLAEEMVFNLNDFYGNHTMTIGYSRQIQFVSEECGERYFYSLLKVLEHDYDSVRIVNATPQPETSTSTNIEIYRCPRTNLAGINFKQIINNQVVPDTVVLLNVDVGFETLIFIPNDTLKTMNIPLNPDAASTTIQFTFNTVSGPSIKNITLTYDRITKKLFEKCGEQVLFTGLDVSSSDFDDFIIVKDSLQDLPIINLEVIQ